MVEQITGAPKESFLKLARLLVENSGRERTAVYAYAMGWAQHTIGVQNIRAAATLQALLGNTGRPGRRDHGTARPRVDPGSTYIATLYDNFPGLLESPDARKRRERTSRRGPKATRCARGAGRIFRSSRSSFLKARYGEHAHRRERLVLFSRLPLNTGDHSDLPMFFAMKDGEVEGLLLYGKTRPSAGRTPRCSAARWSA